MNTFYTIKQSSIYNLIIKSISSINYTRIINDYARCISRQVQLTQTWKMKNDGIYVNFCRNWKKKLSAKNKKKNSVVYFCTCLYFSALFILSTDIIFTEFGTINNLKLPLLYLDKLACMTSLFQKLTQVCHQSCLPSW